MASMESCIAGDRGTSVRKAPLWTDGATIVSIEDILTERERQYIIEAAERTGTCKRSKVKGKGGENVNSASRTSTTCFLPKGGGGDTTVACIERKLASVAGRDVELMEPLQITKYARGQQFKPHYDWFQGHTSGTRQRTTTLFAYLKGLDGGCGGATVFTECKRGPGDDPLRVQPKAGNAVLWDNLNADGSGNTKTRHGGEPVLCDAEKIGLNVWFGDRPY